MTQAQLDRAVAHATGEPIETIEQRGFSRFVPQRRRPNRQRNDEHDPASCAPSAAKDQRRSEPLDAV